MALALKITLSLCLMLASSASSFRSKRVTERVPVKVSQVATNEVPILDGYEEIEPIMPTMTHNISPETISLFLFPSFLFPLHFIAYHLENGPPHS